MCLLISCVVYQVDYPCIVEHRTFGKHRAFKIHLFKLFENTAVCIRIRSSSARTSAEDA